MGQEGGVDKKTRVFCGCFLAETVMRPGPGPGTLETESSMRIVLAARRPFSAFAITFAFPVRGLYWLINVAPYFFYKI